MQKIEQEIRQRTIEKLLLGLAWHTHDELVKLISAHGLNGSQQISAWLNERKIFFVHNDRVLYPQFQFGPQFLPHPVVQKVLECFDRKDAWAIAAWFYFRNGWLEQEKDGTVIAAAPLEVLDDTEAVLSAAMNEQNGTHFAYCV